MTCPCSRSRFAWLRKLCSLVCLVAGCCSLPAARGQDIDKPLHSIDEDVTAFAFADDGRIVYSVRHLYKTKQYDLQRDDIWLQEAGGKRRRLFTGEKFTHGGMPFTYTVDSFRWSPNSRLILVQLYTTSVVDESGRTEDSPMFLVLDAGGREIRINGRDALVENAASAVWLADNITVVYLTETVKPHLLYSFQYVNIQTGPAGKAFDGRTFLDAQPVPHTNTSIAIERDKNLSGPPRLQRLDNLAQDDHELATLDGYAGGLAVSPSGKRAAYFIDKEVLEVRDLESPNRVARLRVGLGVVLWAPDDARVFVKRATEKKSADVVWFAVPPLAPAGDDTEVPVAQPSPVPILHGLTFREFRISPDGKLLGLISTGKRSVLVFPLPT